MMRSASRQAQDALREQENAVFGGRVSADTLTGIADELYSVAALLTGQPRLRRALGDPATSTERRAGLLEQVVSGQLSKQALELAKAAVSLRWSSPWDLTDSIEGAGDDALFAAAEKGRSLDRVEDELFRFERILQTEGEVAAMLDEYNVAVPRRVELLDSLVKAKVSPITLALLHHAVTSQRKRSVTLAIDDLLEKAAARQHRSVARVISAISLTDGQQERLAAALTKMYGRAISVRTALDPQVRGGLVVRVGDEVIDGSIATRFVEARAALAG
ncbi:MAG: F-type H+-transporting ATPase subunit delta [Microbacteriaceae bacterium]|jgi:F-type H+-transporting ATPase subunit delta|nr:F-type H+-transporting ATPase subunit delta [Microbacteriaceae bacterium]